MAGRAVVLLGVVLCAGCNAGLIGTLDAGGSCHAGSCAGGSDAGGLCDGQACGANAHCAGALGPCVCDLGYASVSGACVEALPPQSSAFTVGVTTSMDKVYFETPFDFDGELGGDARIALARNELEATQVVAFPTASLHAVRVSVSDLTSPTGATLPASTISVNVVGYVNLTATKVAGNRTGWQPDPLLPEQPLELAADTPQAWLITVATSDTQPPGTYRGWITLSGKDAAGADAVRSVRLSVEVFGYTLPRTGKFKSAVLCSWGLPGAMWPGQNFTDAQRKEKMLAIADLGFRNRVPPVTCLANGLSSWDWNGQGNTSFGYPTHDGATFNAARTGELIDYMLGKGANHFWIALTSNIYALPARASARETALRQYLTDYRAYLQQRGLLGKAYVYGVDEPWGTTVDDAKAVQAFVKGVAPDIAFLQNTNQNNGTIVGTLLGHFDALDINLGWFDITHVATYRQQNPAQLSDLWWNVNIWPDVEPNLFVEYPLVDARIVGPMSFKHRVQGFEYWALLSTGGIQSYHPVRADELHVAWDVDQHSLDGTLVYPGADGSVYSSLRYESLRDGIEDLEALYLLEAKDPTSPLLRVDTVTNIDTFEHDPQKLLEFRRRVADALAAP